MSGLVDQHGRPVRSGSYYKGTTRGRFRGPLTNQVVDSRQTLNRYTRHTLCGYARTLYENYGEVRGAVDDITRYSVGKGIRPQSQAGDLAAEYEQFFHQWAKAADLGGQFSFWGLQKLASKRMDVDGDLGFNMVTGKNNWPFLQPIEGHRIESPGSDDNIHDGVAINPATGRPAAYFVRQNETHKRIHAKNFILISDPNRVNQYRGVTALSHAIQDVWDTGEILDYEKVGVKAREAIGFALVTEGGMIDDGNDFIDEEHTAEKTGDLPWQTLQAGYIPRLKPGESIEDLAGNRPSPTFQGFLELLMRKTAIGLGIPFEFVWDPTNAGGATQRAVLAKAQRKFTERADLLDEKFNTRVWAWVISKGIARGDVKHSEDFWKVKWQHPKKITVDVGREAKESREDIKLGLKTLADDAGERGIDWQELRKQSEIEALDLIRRAKAIAESEKIPVDLALSLLSQRSANPPIEAKIIE